MPTRAMPGKFLSIVGQDPSDSKSNRLHVGIFQFGFHSFEVYSTESFKKIGNPLEVSNFNRLFLNRSTGSCVNNRRFIPSSPQDGPLPTILVP